MLTGPLYLLAPAKYEIKLGAECIIRCHFVLQIGGRDLARRTNIYCWETRAGAVFSAVQLSNFLVKGRLSGTSLSINIDDLFLIENNWILSVSQAENRSYAWRARAGAAALRVTQPRHFPRWGWAHNR